MDAVWTQPTLVGREVHINGSHSSKVSKTVINRQPLSISSCLWRSFQMCFLGWTWLKKISPN